MEFIKILQKDFKKFVSLKDLNNLADVPSFIYATGNLDLLRSNTITIIGSRKISNYGIDVIKQFVPQIVQSGFCVVSGLAYGCDFQAQKVAVENGGVTIGVLGCGLNHIKSHQHFTFVKQCIDKNVGLFLSEFEPDFPASKWTFIKRDRIMAALGSKLLVIEASLKSGTMHTVNFALELGKEVYAVPGNIYNSNSLGTNSLIQNGANMFLSMSDLLDGYELQSKDKKMFELTERQEIILDFLKDEKTALQIAKLINLNVSEVLVELTLLDLQSLVKQVGDKWVVSSI